MVTLRESQTQENRPKATAVDTKVNKATAKHTCITSALGGRREEGRVEKSSKTRFRNIMKCRSRQ